MKKLIFCLSLMQGFFAFAMQKDGITEYVKDYKTLMSIIHKIVDIAEGIPGKQYELEIRENVKFDFTQYQTQKGFMVEFKYGAPHSIYWRLGRAKFVQGFQTHTLSAEKRFLETLKRYFDIKEDQVYREYKCLYNNGCKDVTSKASMVLYPLNSHTQDLPLAVLKIRESEEYISEEGARKIFKEISKH